MGKKSKRRGGDRSAASTSRGAATGTADVPEDLTAMTIHVSNEAGAAGQSTAAGTTSAVAIGKTRALLPASVWAQSFDYLPYEHVRSARLVCKVFGKEVPRHVETLSVFKSSEMDVPNARHYPNVRELNVFCLLKRQYVRVANRPQPEQALYFNVEAFQKVLSFLHAFTGLEKLFLGGLTIERIRDRIGTHRERYLPNMGMLAVPRNHKDLVRQFMGSLCDAFQTRSLPQDVNLTFINHTRDGHLCTKDEGQSWICKKIFESFPFSFCSDLACRCTTYKDRLEIMAKRPAVKASLLSPQFLEGHLKRHRTFYYELIPAEDLEQIYIATGLFPQRADVGLSFFPWNLFARPGTSSLLATMLERWTWPRSSKDGAMSSLL